MTRPKIAVVTTEFSPHSHADVQAKRLVEGYSWLDGFAEPRTEVVSLYLDQRPGSDIGVAYAEQHGIPLYETVGEALCLGKKGIQVDGVAIIGEHGDFPLNPRAQVMYPRRRLFDAAVAAMTASDHYVPIFMDKHFSWSYQDAHYMYDTAARLGIPLLAGSTVPLMWRSPDVDWPYGAAMSESIAVGYGPPEVYEFHTLEAHQCFVERRAGGETGVRAVHDLARGSFWSAANRERWTEEVLGAALGAADVFGDWDYDARGLLRQVIRVEYADGLLAHILRFDRLVASRAVAARGDDQILACSFRGELSPPWRHASLLVRQIENLFVNGQPAYPVERTLLTTGILEAAMRSRAAGGVRIETPLLEAVRYSAPESIPDTGIGRPIPFSTTTDVSLDT